MASLGDRVAAKDIIPLVGLDLGGESARRVRGVMADISSTTAARITVVVAVAAHLEWVALGLRRATPGMRDRVASD
jgi:hypothetical protein